jgi:YD repeat-containing protein
VRNFSHDALNRCVADWDNVGNTNRYAYDSRSNRVRHTDPLGFSLEGDFDSISRPTSNRKGVGGSAQNTTRYAWDAASRLTATTDGNGNTTQFAYDSLDRLVRTTLADNTTVTNVYDGHGNLVGLPGTEIFSVYDALDRCAETSRSARASPAASVECIIRRVSCRACAAKQTRRSCAHDCQRSGHEYNYDALDRPVSLGWRASAGQASAPLGDLTYIGPCDVARVTRPNGIHTDYTRSGRVGVPNLPGDFGWGQIQRVRHTFSVSTPVEIEDRLFAHDRNQNKTLRALTVPFIPGAQTNRQEFQYDSLDRLVQSVTTQDGLPVQDATYVLDPMGNRQVVIGGGSAQPYLLNNTLPNPADFQVNQYTVTPFDERQYDKTQHIRPSPPTDPVCAPSAMTTPTGSWLQNQPGRWPSMPRWLASVARCCGIAARAGRTNATSMPTARSSRKRRQRRSSPTFVMPHV